MDKKDVMDQIEAQVKLNLAELGDSAKAAQTQVAGFLASIEPEVDEALANNDELSLDLIRDRIAGKLAAVALGVIHRDQVVVITTIMTVIRLAILWGV